MCFYVSPPALNKSEIKSPCIESNSCGRKQEPSIVYEYNYYNFYSRSEADISSLKCRATVSRAGRTDACST